ncbi:MAG: HEAT repeat domain-containing protein, partial [Pseudomonadota bacterium]
MKLHSRACFITGVLILASIPRVLPAQDQAEKESEIIYNKAVENIGKLASPNEQEKIKAAKNLGKIRAAYSVAALKEALKDPSTHVRLAIVDTLGQIATPASAKALTKTATDDSSGEVQVAAVDALSTLHLEASYQGCVSLVQSSKKEKTKQAALDCIRQWNQPHAALKKPIALPKGKKEPTLAKPKIAVEEPQPPEKEAGKDKKKKKKKKEPEKESF